MKRKRGVVNGDIYKYIIVPTAFLFVGVIVSLAMQPKKSKHIIVKVAYVVSICALFLYGYGYANQTEQDISP